jgi:hypothetical protein
MLIHYFAWICGVVQERVDSFVWANGFGAFAVTKAQMIITGYFLFVFSFTFLPPAGRDAKETIPKAIGTRLPILSTQKLQHKTPCAIQADR